LTQAWSLSSPGPLRVSGAWIATLCSGAMVGVNIDLCGLLALALVVAVLLTCCCCFFPYVVRRCFSRCCSLLRGPLRAVLLAWGFGIDLAGIVLLPLVDEGLAKRFLAAVTPWMAEPMFSMAHRQFVLCHAAFAIMRGLGGVFIDGHGALLAATLSYLVEAVAIAHEWNKGVEEALPAVVLELAVFVIALLYVQQGLQAASAWPSFSFGARSGVAKLREPLRALFLVWGFGIDLAGVVLLPLLDEGLARRFLAAVTPWMAEPMFSAAHRQFVLCHAAFAIMRGLGGVLIDEEGALLAATLSYLVEAMAIAHMWRLGVEAALPAVVLELAVFVIALVYLWKSTNLSKEAKRFALLP